ncbi:sugar ABC transporter ATP-binding protein [Peribacillus cavernae]|nr:sugar ABC transporter ATP-binding protein [Peribacillus cavernae]MDQ0218089.1 ABC-type sugar transport system ATPase subunit [Peribacillus cavernae]
MLLEMKQITKEFPGVKALEGVSIKINRSEILALIGENGAGKSTLMKILAGAHQPSSGQIYLHGKPVTIEGPKHSQNLGISIIYQEFNLIPHMSVAENIFIGREPRKAKGILHRKKIKEETRKWLDKVGLTQLSSDTIISDLSVAEQQLVEISKALSFNSQIIIMDEPTAALNDEDTSKLLKIMKELKQQGIGIIFITHRLEEVQAVADRVSVLRDGKYIGSSLTQAITKDEMVTIMVGRELTELFPEKTIPDSSNSIEVTNVNVPNVLQNINFQVKKGEVVGIAGLLGAGKTELSKALFGLYKNMSGTVTVGSMNISSPKQAIDAGIALVTDDRKQEGLVLGLSVYENLLLPAYRKISRFGVLQKDKKDEIVNRWINDLKIKVHDPHVEVRTLSGGNQQKVVLGKWLQMNPKVLILNEPTRGIDVGAKAEIYQIMKRLTEKGISIIMFSSDMPELLGLSHRILVMHGGRISAELNQSKATQENIFYFASGGGVSV